MFSTTGKHFYFNKTQVSEFLNLQFKLWIESFILFKLNWNKAREWCMERGMQLASLKTLNEIIEISKGFQIRNLCNESITKNYRKVITCRALLQIGTVFGYQHQT